MSGAVPATWIGNAQATEHHRAARTGGGPIESRRAVPIGLDLARQVEGVTVDGVEAAHRDPSAAHGDLDRGGRLQDSGQLIFAADRRRVAALDPEELEHA